MKKYQRKWALMMAAVLLISVIPANAIATEEENTAVNTQSTEGEIDFSYQNFKNRPRQCRLLGLF